MRKREIRFFSFYLRFEILRWIVPYMDFHLLISQSLRREKRHLRMRKCRQNKLLNFLVKS